MADTDVDAVVADVRATGLHLGPGTEQWLGERGPAALRDVLERTDVPVHVVLVQPPEDGGIHAGDDLVVRVHDAGAPDGLYLAVNNAWPAGDQPSGPLLPDGRELNLSVQQWGEVAGSTDLSWDVERVLSHGDDGGPFELGEGLRTVVRALDDGTFSTLVAEAEAAQQAAYDEQPGAGGTTGQPTTAPGDPDDGSTGDTVVGLVVLALLVAGAVLGVRWGVRRLRARQRRSYALPRSVLDRVREAGDAELVRRARADVLALGERIDDADMASRLAPAAGSAWAAALDHYEAAGRLLPADTDAAVDPLDAAGAVVLAERGRAALEAARKGKPFVPSTPCYLNPLHGRGTRSRTLTHDGVAVDAPVCARCRRDLEAGRRPDVLDVVVGGRPRHYFETDREPWASTGFGALEPDLVARLHRGRR